MWLHSHTVFSIHVSRQQMRNAHGSNALTFFVRSLGRVNNLLLQKSNLWFAGVWQYAVSITNLPDFAIACFHRYFTKPVYVSCVSHMTNAMNRVCNLVVRRLTAKQTKKKQKKQFFLYGLPMLLLLTREDERDAHTSDNLLDKFRNRIKGTHACILCVQMFVKYKNRLNHSEWKVFVPILMWWNMTKDLYFHVRIRKKKCDLCTRLHSGILLLCGGGYAMSPPPPSPNSNRRSHRDRNCWYETFVVVCCLFVIRYVKFICLTQIRVRSSTRTSIFEAIFEFIPWICRYDFIQQIYYA